MEERQKKKERKRKREKENREIIAVQDGIKTEKHVILRPNPSLGSFRSVAFETVPMFV